MNQAWIPATFWRGGTSKGVFFLSKDLPTAREKIDPILLAVMGTPDPYGRQLNGLGGGTSSLSKAVIIGPPTHPDADVDYHSSSSLLTSRLLIGPAIAEISLPLSAPMLWIWGW